MQTSSDLKSLAVAYIEAAGAKDYATVSRLLAPDVTFKGPFTTTGSSEAYVAALRRMSPIWKNSEVRDAFSYGDRACVVYDFVTDTAAGALPCVEVLSFSGERISHVELFFEPAQFAPAAAELAQRAEQ